MSCPVCGLELKPGVVAVRRHLFEPVDLREVRVTMACNHADSTTTWCGAAIQVTRSESEVPP